MSRAIKLRAWDQTLPNRYALTDLYTGELIDLRTLARPARARRRVTRRKKARGREVNHWAFVVLVSVLGLWITTIE
jgi:hypothetical protein